MKAMTDTYQAELRKLQRVPVVQATITDAVPRWTNYSAALPSGQYAGFDSCKNVAFDLSGVVAGNDNTIVRVCIMQDSGANSVRVYASRDTNFSTFPNRSTWSLIWTGTTHRVRTSGGSLLGGNIGVYYHPVLDAFVVSWYAHNTADTQDEIHSLVSYDDGASWNDWDAAPFTSLVAVLPYTYGSNEPGGYSITHVQKDMYRLGSVSTDTAILIAGDRALFEAGSSNDGDEVYILNHLGNDWDTTFYRWTNGRLFNITDIDAETIEDSREIYLVLSGSNELSVGGAGSFYLFSCRWNGELTPPGWSRLETLFAKDVTSSTYVVFQHVRLNRYIASNDPDIQWTLAFSWLNPNSVPANQTLDYWCKARDWDTWSDLMLIDEGGMTDLNSRDDKVYYYNSGQYYYSICFAASRKTTASVTADVSDDIMEFGVTESPFGAASTLNLNINNLEGTSNKWFAESGNPAVGTNASAVRRNAMITLKEGYSTPSGQEAITIGKFYIDDFIVDNNPDNYGLQIQARNGIKKLKNFSTVEQIGWESQEKFYAGFGTGYYYADWTPQQIPGQQQGNAQWTESGGSMNINPNGQLTVLTYNGIRPFQNGVIEVKLKSSSWSTSNRAGMTFRYTNKDGSTSFYALVFENASVRLAYYDSETAAWTNVFSTNFSPDFSNSTYYWVRVLFNYSRFWGYVSTNGTSWTVLWNSPATSIALPQFDGLVGLFAEGTHDVSFDEFKFYDMINDHHTEYVVRAIAAKAFIFRSETETYFETEFQNQVENPSFKTATTGWTKSDSGGASSTFSRVTDTYAPEAEDTASGKVVIATPGGSTPTNVKLYRDDITVHRNSTYIISFFAKATAQKNIQLIVQDTDESPIYIPTKTFTISDKWQRYYYKYTVGDFGSPTDTSARLQFNLNDGTASTVWIDGVQFESLKEPDQILPSKYQSVYDHWGNAFGSIFAFWSIYTDNLRGDNIGIGAQTDYWGYTALQTQIPADFRVEMRIRLDHTTGETQKGRIVYRHTSQSALDDGYCFDFGGADAQAWELFRLDAGSFTQIGAALPSSYWFIQANNMEADQWSELILVANGPWHTVQVNGQIIVTAYDDTYLAESFGQGYFIIGGGLLNSALEVDNLRFPQMWQPVPAITFSPSDDGERKMKDLVESVGGVYWLTAEEVLKVRKLKTSDKAVWEFDYNQLLSNSYSVSDKEMINQAVVYGWFRKRGEAFDFDKVKELGSLRPQVFTDEKLVGQYAVDERAKLELELSKTYLEQPDPTIDAHPGLDLYDIITLTDTKIGLNSTNYRLFSLSTKYQADGNGLTQQLGIGKVTGLAS